jgi:hypothetical protein
MCRKDCCNVHLPAQSRDALVFQLPICPTVTRVGILLVRLADEVAIIHSSEANVRAPRLAVTVLTLKISEKTPWLPLVDRRAWFGAAEPEEWWMAWGYVTRNDRKVNGTGGEITVLNVMKKLATEWGQGNETASHQRPSNSFSALSASSAVKLDHARNPQPMTCKMLRRIGAQSSVQEHTATSCNPQPSRHRTVRAQTPLGVSVDDTMKCGDSKNAEKTLRYQRLFCHHFVRLSSVIGA